MSVIERVRASAPAERNIGGTERVARLTIGAILTLVGLAMIAGLRPAGTAGLVATAVVLLVGARLLWTGYTCKCRLKRRLARRSRST